MEHLSRQKEDISNVHDLAPETDPATDLDEGELAGLEGEDYRTRNAKAKYSLYSYTLISFF